MIQVERVNKYFYRGEAREVHALRDVTLTFEEGEFTVITGPSGCGKTTLFNAIGALDSVDEGHIRLGETDITLLDEEARTRLRLEKIGFVFQAYNLVPVLSVRENIGFILQLQGRNKKEIDARVRELAAMLQIENKLDFLPNQLSGGQQQRVAVARAVASRPSIILADEPTANLDSVNSEHLMDMMAKLNDIENVTILFASHDDLVVKRSRRQVKLHDGQVVSD